MGNVSYAIGAAMEELAADFLAGIGYMIVERNYRTRVGEIDAVAWHGETLVFVEVRYRKSSALVTAQESLTPKKVVRLVRAARRYISEKGIGDSVPVRIDLCVVGDLGRSFEVLRGITGFV